MNPLKPFTNPAYLFRPRQILHRFRRAFGRGPLSEYKTVTLPWGLQLRVRPTEVIGANIWCYGVFDLVVCETICRLLDESEVGLDVGANIGQMTGLMRCRSGRNGRVIAFEPHPELFAALRHNTELLQPGCAMAPTEIHNLAASDVSGEARLDTGPNWSLNQGVPRLVSSEQSASGPIVRVKATRLDDVLSNGIEIGVCKMDVDGHELSVLKGATQILKARHIRDLIFEDFGTYPSPVHQFLIDHGFTLFSLHTRLWKPLLVPASSRAAFRPNVDGENYLATLNPERANARFKKVGWFALAGNPSRFAD